MNVSKERDVVDAGLATAEVGTLLAAVSFAATKHQGQRRKGKEGEPYINHPIRVAEILCTIGGVRDVTTLAAALLHDTLEDTATTPEELAAAFGPDVLGLVQEVTDDKALLKAERKRLQIEHAPHHSPRAKLIKLADKIQNVHDLSVNPPASWSLDRLRAYVEWADQVVAGLRGVNPNLESAYDEVARQARLKFDSGDGGAVA